MNHTLSNQRRRSLKTVLAGAVLLLALSAPVESGEAENGRMRITSILPAKSEGVYWQEIVDGMERAAGDLGADLSVIYTESYGNYPAIDINSALEMASLYQTDAIILSYSKNADQETDRLLRSAREEGIRVVIIDSDVDETLRDVYVGIDNEEAARSLARTALEELDQEECAVLFYSSNNSNMENISRRIQGIISAFEEAGASSRLILLPADANTELQRMNALRGALEEYPQTRVIFTLSERVTVVAAQYLAQNSLTDTIHIYGFDYTDEAADLLEKKELSVLIGQQQDEMGYQSVAAAVRLVESEELPSDKLYIDFQTYTQDNVTDQSPSEEER